VRNEAGRFSTRPSLTRTLETAPDELVRGTVFAGRYQIIEELGYGGMDKVYRALDKKLNEEVALKLIKPEIASDRETLERFGNELRLARKVAQRKICKMYDLGEAEGAHHFEQEKGIVPKISSTKWASPCSAPYSGGAEITC